MLALESGWQLDVERGPDWLFVRLQAPVEPVAEGAELAESIWNLLEQHFLQRVVLDLSEVPALQSWLLGQLVRLHKRLTTRGGLMRLCGVSSGNELVLRSARLEDRFPAYATRAAAVMGQRPAKPR